jgi:hypothetical protein
MKLLIVATLVVLLGYLSYTPDIPVEELIRFYTDEQSRFIDIDGTRVHYKVRIKEPVGGDSHLRWRGADKI